MENRNIMKYCIKKMLKITNYLPLTEGSELLNLIRRNEMFQKIIHKSVFYNF